MAIVILATGSAPSTNNSTAVVTLDTTGATGIIVLGGITPQLTTVTDSRSNTYAKRGPDRNSGTANRRALVYDCLAPTSVGAGTIVTLTTTSGNGFPEITVYAVSGTDSASFSSEVGAGTSTGTTIQPTSITPPQNGCLLAVAGAAGSNFSGIDSGFTATLRPGTANSIAGLGAYLIQATAAAVNPTLSYSPSQAAAVSMACYKPAAAAFKAAFARGSNQLIGLN